MTYPDFTPTPPPVPQSTGAIVLTYAELSDADFVAIINAGPQISLTLLGTLRALLNVLPNGTAAPLSGDTFVIPDNQQFTSIVPAALLASLTIALPANFPDGVPCEIVITQAITALTISPSSPDSLVGNAISATPSSAGLSLSYRRQGTTWYRTK